MKKNITMILIILYSIFLMYFSIVKQNDTFSNIFNTLNIWLYKVLPPIFIFYLISALLLSSRAVYIIFYILKPLRKLFRFETTNAFNIFILSIFLGNPSSSSFVTEYSAKGLISQKDNIILLKCASFINPLFVFSIIPDKSQAIIIYIIPTISNFLLAIFLTRKNNIFFNKQLENNINFFDSLNNLIKILFTIAVLMVICNLTIYSLSLLNIPLSWTFFLELSQGAIYLTKNNNSLSLYLLVSLLAFGGLCIHMQVLSTIKKANLYKVFALYRIISAIISILLFSIYTYFA